MHTAKRFVLGSVGFHKIRFSRPFLLLVVLLTFAATVQPQNRPGEMPDIRGNRAEISVIIRDGSSQLVGPLVTVKFYYNGAIVDQKTTSKGRAVFILNHLGDYTISVEAVGYRTAQKDISVRLTVDSEEQIILQRDSSPEALGAAGRPVLAPKAKEAFDRALESFNENKFDQAEKHIEDAAELAPNHPDVLYLHGVILLKLARPVEAQAVLEKTTQIDPQNARAFTALGMAFINENKYDLAAAPLKQSVELDPTNWESHWTLAGVLYHQQQYESALKECQLARDQAHGTQPAVELLLAQAQVGVGKFEDAAETLRAFIRNHKNDKDVPKAKKWLDRMTADGKIRKQ